MTRAPAHLLAARNLLLTHLDNSPGPDDLEPAEVGIVGDAAHRGGYHCGADRVVTNDYSVVESPRDRAGLDDDASALDVGPFKVTSGGKTHTLQTFSIWCVGECAAKAPDTLDIREIIYSPDGKTVKRWDRLGKRTSGDLSHLYHTHFSLFRDAKQGLLPLLRRYLQTHGLMEDDMSLTTEEHEWLRTVHKNLTVLDGRNPIGQMYTRMAMGTDATVSPYVSSHATLESLEGQIRQLQTGLTTLAGKDFTNEAEIAALVLKALTPDTFAQAMKLAGLTPERLAELVPEQDADRFVDAIAARLADRPAQSE